MIEKANLEMIEEKIIKIQCLLRANDITLNEICKEILYIKDDNLRAEFILCEFYRFKERYDQTFNECSAIIREINEEEECC